MRILLIAYDNEMFINFFPQGIAYVAAVLKSAGHFVEIYNQDMHHYPDESVTEHLNRNHYDFVGIGVIGGYYQYRKLLSLSQAINDAKNRPFFIIGGHGPSPEPEYFLKKTNADAAVIGEGEQTILELIDAVDKNIDLHTVSGIAFRDGDEVVVNNRRALIEDVDSIPLPAYDLFPMEYYRLKQPVYSKKTDFGMRVLSGRGCKFKCNFCYRMDKGFRPRSEEAIVEEIQLLKKDYAINTISFTDELLMSSEDRVIRLCELFIKQNLNINWDCNGRLNYAKPRVLQMMKRAGCRFINYGIEAFDDQVLKNMNKALTTKQIIRGTEETIKVGISPGLNIIFGNIGDNEETLSKGAEFLMKYDDCAYLRTIRPVTPYPGSPLYYYAIEKGLLKDVEDFYENKHTNSDLLAVNFTELSDEKLHSLLFSVNKKLISRYYNILADRAIESAERLYLQGDTEFRGFRQT